MTFTVTREIGECVRVEIVAASGVGLLRGIVASPRGSMRELLHSAGVISQYRWPRYVLLMSFSQRLKCTSFVMYCMGVHNDFLHFNI